MESVTGAEWLVITGGVAAIIWVNWYFFFAQPATAAVVAEPVGTGESGIDVEIPQVTITVDGGYAPSTVRVKSGRPVRLVFDRRDESSCSEEVVLPDFGIRRFLPSGRQTMVEVTPAKPGTYEFMCGMSMLRGRLIAEE
jgi:plastocyanin domain-containing protein